MCIQILSLHKTLEVLECRDTSRSSVAFLRMAAATSDMYRLETTCKNVRLIHDENEPLLGLMIQMGARYGIYGSCLDRLDKYLGYLMVTSKGA